MNFDISRQSFVTAFLLLFALAVTAAVYNFGTEAVSAVVPAAGVAIASPAELIDALQTGWPVWSQVIAVALILFAAMTIGRMTIRYNLYSVHTCLAISLFGIVLCAMCIGPNYLCGLTLLALFALSTKNICRACTDGYAFDSMFRAALYLGAMVLVQAATLPLVATLLLSAMLFRRTLRDVLVALAGLVFLPLLYCYINWGAGGDFLAPVQSLGWAVCQGTPLILFINQSIYTLAAFCLIALASLCAGMLFLGNAYAAGNRPRHILTYNIGLLLLTGATLCGPAASPQIAPLLAVPASILLPILFLRINKALSLVIYILLLVLAVACIFLQ